MPAKTENYKLNQWKKEDDFLMRDFNADNAAIEDALTGLKSAVDSKAAQSEVDTLKTTVNGLSSSKANQSDLNNLTNTVNTKADAGTVNQLTDVVNGKTSVVVGSYTGNGEATQDIYLGFQPKAVLITSEYGAMYNSNANCTYGGIAMPGRPLNGLATPEGAVVTSTGFRVSFVDRCYLNANRHVYHYIVWA